MSSFKSAFRRLALLPAVSVQTLKGTSVAISVWTTGWQVHKQCRCSTLGSGQGQEKLRLFKSTLNLEDASAIVDACMAHGRTEGLLPLAVVVLDAGGGIVAIKREDGCAVMRVDIATGKAYAALSMGMSTRQLRDRLSSRPSFMASLSDIGSSSGKGWVPVPGGVLILDATGAVVGSIGVSGDTSDKDEAVAIAAVLERSCLTPDPAEPSVDWKMSTLNH